MTYDLDNPSYKKHALYLKAILNSGSENDMVWVNRLEHVIGDRKSGIYVVLNTVTNDYYVGSAKDIHTRVLSHRRCLAGKGSSGSNPLLAKHGKKYGSDVFKFLVIHYGVNEECLEQVENFWLKALDPFYNINRKARRPTYSKRMRETMSEFAKNKRDNTVFCVPILQCDLNGQFIKEWPSVLSIRKHYGKWLNISLGARENKIDGSKRVIHGYHWAYKNDPTPKRNSRDMARKVQQIDPSTGIIVNVWDSKEAVAEFLKYHPSSINCAIRRNTTTGGFKWRYDK